MMLSLTAGRSHSEKAGKDLLLHRALTYQLVYLRFFTFRASCTHVQIYDYPLSLSFGPRTRIEDK